jgi:hypothetical protein
VRGEEGLNHESTRRNNRRPGIIGAGPVWRFGRDGNPGLVIGVGHHGDFAAVGPIVDGDLDLFGAIFAFLPASAPAARGRRAIDAGALCGVSDLAFVGLGLPRKPRP